TRRLNPSVAEPERLEGALDMAAKAFARGRTPLDPQSFVESVFLADRHKGEDHLSALELRNLPQFFALQQVLRPMATAASSLDALGPVVAAFGGPSARQPSGSSGTASDDI